jgi:4-hydroxyproline epimerase
MRHTFICIDGHTAGNPVRLIAGGAPILEGGTMSEKRSDGTSKRIQSRHL